jgi:hypothetical protein
MIRINFASFCMTFLQRRIAMAFTYSSYYAISAEYSFVSHYRITPPFITSMFDLFSYTTASSLSKLATPSCTVPRKKACLR